MRRSFPTRRPTFARVSPSAQPAEDAFIAEALKEASDQQSAFATTESKWMQTHIVPGTTRNDAYAMIRSRNITASNETPSPHPDAVVKIYGAFGLGCSQSVATTLTFDNNDRVSKVTVVKEEPSCL